MQPVLTPPTACSLVIPVYRNGEGIVALVDAVAGIAARTDAPFEAIFVVDGSPDDSYTQLARLLPDAPFDATLIALSRNFGAFAAIREGLVNARGQRVAVMAADLQEPPELVLELFDALHGGDGVEGADVAFGVRADRHDPWSSKLMSALFWGIYRRVVVKDIPSGGVDVFAVSAWFKTQLLTMTETGSSLLAQLFWLGGRRRFVPYVRQARQHGRSAWTLSKKLRYFADSVFAFTDLPVRLLILAGLLGMLVSGILGLAVIASRLAGHTVVPGYAATMLAVLFFGAFNAFGLGIVGNYAWRAYENTKARPLAVVQSILRNRREPDDVDP